MPKPSCCATARRSPRYRRGFTEGAAREGGGNDGTVESVGNHEQVSPSSPRPLGNLARAARFPHSHRQASPRWGVWKTKQRFFTLPSEARDGDFGSLIRTPEPNPRAFRPKDRRKAASRSSAAAISVSSCVGNESRFQYHSWIGKCLSRQMLERYSHIRMTAKRNAMDGITLPEPTAV